MAEHERQGVGEAGLLLHISREQVEWVRPVSVEIPHLPENS